jgi:L-threonylcarbamoyladenylate synthase
LVLKSNSRRIFCVSGENNTIGVRIPDCVDLKELIGGFGKPLAATSANYISQKPPRLLSEIPADIVSKVDFTCGFKVTPSGIASTVVDCTSDKVNIIRQGEISFEDIQRFLGDS